MFGAMEREHDTPDGIKFDALYHIGDQIYEYAHEVQARTSDYIQLLLQHGQVSGKEMMDVCSLYKQLLTHRLTANGASRKTTYRFRSILIASISRAKFSKYVQICSSVSTGTSCFECSRTF